MLQPIKVNNHNHQKLPPKLPRMSLNANPSNNKVQLANKLQVSPLNQELKLLGPLSPSKNPMNFKEPVFTKYSHREVILPPRKVSPSTLDDPDKPRLMNKNKAKKLMLLCDTIRDSID